MSSIVSQALASIVSIIINAFVKLFGGIIDIVLSIIPFTAIPDLSSYINAINNFWHLLFSLFGWVCNALMITRFDLEIILLSLSIKLLYKPIISLVKLFIKWYDTLKGFF